MKIHIVVHMKSYFLPFPYNSSKLQFLMSEAVLASRLKMEQLSLTQILEERKKQKQGKIFHSDGVASNFFPHRP